MHVFHALGALRANFSMLDLAAALMLGSTEVVLPGACKCVRHFGNVTQKSSGAIHAANELRLCAAAGAKPRSRSAVRLHRCEMRDRAHLKASEGVNGNANQRGSYNSPRYDHRWTIGPPFDVLGIHLLHLVSVNC
jgi:hypothetical protein